MKSKFKKIGNFVDIKEHLSKIATAYFNEYHLINHQNSYQIGHPFKVTFKTEDGNYSAYFRVQSKQLRDEMHYYLFHPEVSGEVTLIHKDIFFVKVNRKVIKILKIEEI
jgi:hypothetical protein